MSTESATCVIIGGSIAGIASSPGFHTAYAQASLQNNDTAVFAGTFFAAAAAPLFGRVLVLDRDQLETNLLALQKPSHDYQSLCEVRLLLLKAIRVLKLSSSPGNRTVNEGPTRNLQEAANHKSVFQSLQMHVLLSGANGKQ